MSKAIVFDLDETLRSLDNFMNYNKTSVMLRPGLKELLSKLANVNKKGVDSIIFTSASIENVKKYFINELSPKYRNVFTKIITRENYLKPEADTRENYLYRLGANKIVTALDYDEILFFDANMSEYQFLSELYDKKLDCEYPEPDKSVTLVRLPFKPKKQSELYALKETAKNLEDKGKKDFSEKVKKYFEMLTKEPGCKIMINIIDDFVINGNKKKFDYIAGTEEFEEYNKKLNKCNENIENMLYDNTNISDIYMNYEDTYYENTESKDLNELY